MKLIMTYYKKMIITYKKLFVMSFVIMAAVTVSNLLIPCGMRFLVDRISQAEKTRTSVLKSSWRLRIQERIHILVLVFHLRLERQIQTSGNIVSSVIPERFRRMNI